MKQSSVVATRAIFVVSSFLTTGCGGDSAAMSDGGDVDGGPVDMDAGADAGPATCDPIVLPALGASDIAPGHTFDQPVHVTQAPGDDAHLYVVEKGGFIQQVTMAGGAVTGFLDISATIGGPFGETDERGLLSVAFHPGYATNGRYFVGYRPAGLDRNIVAEYRRGSGAEVARLVSQADPASNHNGGLVMFGPDDYLYAGMGDGGDGCDDHGGSPAPTGQRIDTLLGKILRLDVDASGSGYAAAGNPLVAAGALAQIWDYGLRNPWRFSFDRRTGDLYIGDVGQNAIEEIDVEPAHTGGIDYGWNTYEGAESSTVSECTPERLGTAGPYVAPVVTVRHGDDSGLLRSACSITGGYVYRGAAIPGLDGVYLFGDYCSGDVGAFRWCGGSATGARRVPALQSLGTGLASFGQDNAGELYVVYTNDGTVLKIEPG